MKRLLNTLLLLFISIIPSIAQTYKNINPAYLGIILIDEPTLKDMKSTCEYYNLKEQDAEGDYTVYKHSDGTVLKFKIDFEGNRKYPTVILQTGSKKKDIVKILSDAGYKDIDGLYWRGSKHEIRRTKCDFKQGVVNTLTFTKEYNDI